jgi:hypothetical protein
MSMQLMFRACPFGRTGQRRYRFSVHIAAGLNLLAELTPSAMMGNVTQGADGGGRNGIYRGE